MDHQTWHTDKAGSKAPTHLKNKTFFHPKTAKLYITKGVVFDAERGRWMIQYMAAEGEIMYAHLPEDFTRVEANGLPRFIEVKE